MVLRGRYMKKTLFILCIAAATCLAGCYKDGTDYESRETRITVYPEIPTFNADGTTASGEDSYVGTVTVFEGTAVSDMGWKLQPVNNVAWASLADASLVLQYPENSGKVFHDVSSPGFEVTMQPNSGYKRIFDVDIIAGDGTTERVSFVQYGLKADAEVTVDVASIDIPAAGGVSDDISYTSNMTEYSYSIEYDAESGEGWLSVVDHGPGKVALNAAEWTDKTKGRSATLVITVGTAATSTASARVRVNQLKNDVFYYVFGPSVGVDRAEAIQTSKLGEGVYSFKGFVFDAAAGNLVCINKASRSETYPVYYLCNDGTIGSSDVAVTASDLTLAANGVYNITMDFNLMTWSMARVTKISRYLPDSELAAYPSKDYPTEAGGVKTWMTVSLHWDGGTGTGAYKLGTGVASGSGQGAYTIVTTTTPIERTAANEMTENGGSIAEFISSDGVTPFSARYGRLYTQTEAITGVPAGGLEKAQWVNFPQGEPGTAYTDDAGRSMELQCVTAAKLATYAANAAGDLQAEQENPTLAIQIQGICPFGWHIANMQDWKDLIWAGSAAGAGDYPVSETHAHYGSIASTLKIPNMAALMYSSEWSANTTIATDPVVSSKAAEFGWNMMPTGWRLISKGWQYGPDDSSSKPGFITAIPLMADSNGDGARHRSWRAVVTGLGHTVTFAATQVVGEGSGTAVRCVKNYNNK